MGFYQYDDPALYRNNILDIPIDRDTGVALNQGVVQVRCFIHPYCPFVKVSREEYDLTFNELTIPVINQILPDNAKDSFSTTHGIDGMHFTERYVYRHNYIVEEELDTTGPTPVTNFKQVVKPDYDSVNNTRYMEEQSWIVRPSVFDHLLTDRVNLSSSATYFEQRCQEVPSWSYVYPNITGSYSETDELLDYQTQYFKDNSKYAPDATKNNNPGINTNRVQFPKQTASTDCLGGGAHWRVEKKTPLFRGEDFFIEFKRYAKSTSVNSTERNTDNVFDPAFDYYAPIDVYGDTWAKNASFPLPITPPRNIYINRAVREADDLKEREAMRLFDQAYYIIEIGDPINVGDEDGEHYFIIITERAYPIFVSIDEFDGFIFSKKLSVYGEENGGIHGSAIINASTSRITVRNHLGKLIIYFDINGERSTPWIISKTNYTVLDDLKADAAAAGQDIEVTSPITIPFSVPNAKIQIWGGNLSCGFCFGPLQYVKEKLEFRWPQQHMLPMNTKISARLTTSDDFIHDMARYVDVPGSPNSVEPLFTQGAHFYKQWGTSNVFNKLNHWKQGIFFFGQGSPDTPLIELSGLRNIYPGVRDVTVELRDFNGVRNDNDRRKAKFFLEVFLESGSHVFDGLGGGLLSGWRERATFIEPTVNNLNDRLWVVSACKTPILTGIRLVGEENSEPRWADGTTGFGGYAGLPNPDAPNFRDVSHHVLSYSDSWTANDFYELEHSGTIRFLLKEVLADVTNNNSPIVFNDVGYLVDLQDKNFYIEVWAGYAPTSRGQLEYTRMGGFYKLMTGMCHGGMIDKTAAREIMTCQIKDYKEVLKDQKFFNSPFFDGMRDVNALLEILKMAGFRSKGPYDPARLINTIKEDDYGATAIYQTPDGRRSISNYYALPSSYRRIEQAYYKFEAGTTLYDGILKIAQSASKLFYFDQHGVAHFESYMDLVMQGLLAGSNPPSLFEFTSNPYGPNSSITGTGPYGGQQIFNKVEWQHRQEDVHNHLRILTSTPNQDLIIRDDLRWEAFDDPAVEGFIGYLKLFYQKAGMLGSDGAARQLLNFYRIMFLPEVFIKFETMGLPIRATDFITVDGETLRVSKVSHEIDGEKNRWWMNVEGERMQLS